MTRARDLVLETLASLQSWDSLEEQASPGNDAFLPIVQAMTGDKIGAMRVWHGQKICKLVYAAMRMEAAKIDSHMLFAFTPSQSPLPHFTVDSIKMGPGFAFHLDLIPRVDLGIHLNYMREVYGQIQAVFKQADGDKSFAPAHLSPYQRAVMSPFMLANRTDETGFEKVFELVRNYLKVWQYLVDEKEALLKELATDVDYGKRDQKNREIIFSKEIDPVWNQIEPFIGVETGSKMRAVLKNPLKES